MFAGRLIALLRSESRLNGDLIRARRGAAHRVASDDDNIILQSGIKAADGTTATTGRKALRAGIVRAARRGSPGYEKIQERIGGLGPREGDRATADRLDREDRCVVRLGRPDAHLVEASDEIAEAQIPCRAGGINWVDRSAARRLPVNGQAGVTVAKVSRNSNEMP